MYSSSPGFNLDVEALSGICGSISIACWIVVFSPQIIENFRRHSADGLSLIFILIWLFGDVFNIIGSVLQGVIPTMTILAVYYTFADIVLLGQCFFYRGFTLSDPPAKSTGPTDNEEAVEDEPTEESPLLAHHEPSTPPRFRASDADRHRRASSFSSFHSHLHSVDATHLSPTTPLISAHKPTADPPAASAKPVSRLRSTILNICAIVLVCAAGILGWFLSTRTFYPRHDDSHHHEYSPAPAPATRKEEAVQFDLWGQIFGYLCAALYLSSRMPQLLLNYRRKSTEGVSILFFLFACVGNLTYVMSILAYEPGCASIADGTQKGPRGCGDGEWRREYGRYMLVNTSWLVGSAGTLFLDFVIFAQFWIYRHNEKA